MLMLTGNTSGLNTIVYPDNNVIDGIQNSGSACVLATQEDPASNKFSISMLNPTGTDQLVLVEYKPKSLNTFRYNEYDNLVYKIYIPSKNEKRDNINLLIQIGALKDGWDGECAKAFDELFINKVINIVDGLKYQPEIFPTACGTIQMEYEKEDGSYLEFEVSEDGNLKVFSIDKNGCEKTDYLEATSQKINEVVNSFYG